MMIFYLKIIKTTSIRGVVFSLKKRSKIKVKRIMNELTNFRD